jgi:glycosyltransferase involved in cell wall biosynthesis
VLPRSLTDQFDVAAGVSLVPTAPARSAAAGVRIAVVIPCYCVARQIERVLRRIGPEVWRVYCIDDGCPQGSGATAQRVSREDRRIRVISHDGNQGVGAAMVTGYRQAIRDGADVIVKLDGDGQMDPDKIRRLVAPILLHQADYVKGNRFFHLESLRGMSWVRLIGNAGLSFWTKLSSGYWNSFDPTNGFTAIHGGVAGELPFDKLSRRFFFESDLLFRLNLLGAVVENVPLDAHYADEVSNLSPLRSLLVFPFLHARNLAKRIFYSYFLRDFGIASVNLAAGLAFTAAGTIFGTVKWIEGARTQVLASAGTVVLPALLVILGIQFLLAFVHCDVASIPKTPLHLKLRGRDFEQESTASGTLPAHEPRAA